MTCHAANRPARATNGDEKKKWPSAREWLSRGANGPALRCNGGQP